MDPFFLLKFQTGATITDQMDLLQEQVKLLAAEVALSSSSLRRLSEQATRSPDNSMLKVGSSTSHSLSELEYS